MVFRTGVSYDGWADLASLAIQSANGRFGGVRAGNATFSGASGAVGVSAAGVTFTGPMVVGGVAAADAAQPNGRAIQVSGIAPLQFTAGASSQGATVAPQRNAGRFEENGADVTARIVSGP